MIFRLRRKLQTTRRSTVRATLHKSVRGAIGLAVLAGALSVESVESASADGPGGKSPLDWLKDRSAETRYKLFSKDHDRARATQSEASEPDRKQGLGTLERVQSVLNLRRAEPMPQFLGQSPKSPETNAQPFPRPVSPTGAASIQPVGGESYIDAGYENTTSDPNQLKKVTSILPFADYSPIDAPEQEISENLRQPEEIELNAGEVPARSMEATVFQWQPSNLWHHPLYFEDPGLERTGHTFEPVFQPFCSIGRFGVQLVGLPYQMTIDPICKKRYALGWYRPGECAPKQVGQIPWNTKAVINQAAVTTGMVFALP